MKQIEKVSIGGYAFSLEKEASQAVEAYLKEMSEYYPNPEIVEGIEERMAELLLEKTPKDGVVSLASVREIIEILGRPEKIEAEEPEQSSARQETRRKKLYRDMENAKLGGVCSGLASYFNIDVAVFRILFAAAAIAGFFGGLDDAIGLSFTFPLIYILLWVCMPAALTAKQRWEQKGEDGTAESIRRSIESGAAELGAAAERIGKSPAWGGLGRAVELIIGLVLLIVSVSGLFTCGLGLFGWEWLGFKSTVDRLIAEISYELPQFTTIIETPWVMYLAIVVCILPFLGMLYGSIMMIFHFKSPSWHPGLVIFILWLIALVALAILILACGFSADQQHIFVTGDRYLSL